MADIAQRFLTIYSDNTMLQKYFKSGTHSLWIWGLLTSGAGLVMLVMPSALLEVLGLSSADSQSLAGMLSLGRLLGLVMLGYSLLYWIAAVTASVVVIQATVLLRSGVLPLMAVLIALDVMPIRLLLLGVLDAFGAWWTSREFRGAVAPRYPRA